MRWIGLGADPGLGRSREIEEVGYRGESSVAKYSDVEIFCSIRLLTD